VIAVIDRDFVPAILVQAVTGLAELTSDNALFADPLARRMLVDVLNERGYRTTATVEMRDVPTRIDPATYDIVLTSKPRYHFEVHFQGSQIRRGN
jgi:adenylate kinase